MALGHAVLVSVKAPAALTAVCTVQVAHTEPSVDADFAGHQTVPGTDIAIAAGKSVQFPGPAAKDLRIISAGAEGAQRDFQVTLIESMD